MFYLFISNEELHKFNVYILFQSCNKMHKKLGGGVVFVLLVPIRAKTESLKMYENISL